MAQHDARHDVLALPEDLGSIRRARDHVRARCRDMGVPTPTCDTAVLLTSEVVTNALVHARSAPRLGVTVRADVVLVEVQDDDPARPQPAPEVRPSAPSGRGLQLLDRLADDWGVTATGPGKVVWFSLAR